MTLPKNLTLLLLQVDFTSNFLLSQFVKFIAQYFYIGIMAMNLKSEHNFPTMDYEFITSQYRSIDNIRFKQPQFHSNNLSFYPQNVHVSFSIINTRDMAVHWNCMKVIAAFTIDKQIYELQNGPNAHRFTMPRAPDAEDDKENAPPQVPTPATTPYEDAEVMSTTAL